MKTNTKDGIKLVCSGIGGVIGAIIPITLAYFVWDWAMGCVNPELAYAGVIKVAITLFMILGGGGLTIACTIWCALLLGGLILFMAELIFS